MTDEEMKNYLYLTDEEIRHNRAIINSESDTIKAKRKIEKRNKKIDNLLNEK